MVANYRCNEIKEEALELAQGDIAALKKKTDVEIISGFKEACMVPVTNAIKHYDENRVQYGKALTIPSQIRQVHFFKHFLDRVCVGKSSRGS